MELCRLLFTLGKSRLNKRKTVLISENSQANTSERPHAPHAVTIHDIAGDEDKYTLDSHGFQFVKHESKEKDFLDDAQIKAAYYPEVEQLLKDR
jgi:hypothetical protein